MPNDPRRTASDVPPASPTELAEESVVTAYDKAIAPRFWAHYGTPLFRALLAAKEDGKWLT